jgi:hypothetical protein
MHTITLREFVVSFGTVFRDKLSSNSVVIVRGMAAKLEPAKDYKILALSPRQWKNQALAAIHSQTLPVKNTLKYYYEFYLTNQLQDYFSTPHK